MPAFNRNKVSSFAKERIIEAFLNDEDFLEVAEVLKVKRVTAYSIVARRDETFGNHGGKRYQKFDDDMKAMAIEILSENPAVTLKDLNAILRTRMPEKPRVHMRTLANALDGLAYTVKLSRDVPADRNRPDVKDDRYEYARWLTNSDIVNTKKVYVDEFGVNIHTKRNEARSVRGTRAYRTVSGQKGRNVTVCLAICADYGIVYYEIYRGGMNMNRFQSFVEICSGNLIAENISGHIIFDNAPAHRNIEETSVNSINFKRLPKYSPFLNPVENAISCWKSEFKNQMARRQGEFVTITEEGRNGRTLAEYRFDLISEILEASKTVVTSEKCRAWEQYVLSYLPSCLAKEDIQG